MNDGLNPNGLSSRLELSVNRPRASAAFHLTLLEGMRGFERVERDNPRDRSPSSDWRPPFSSCRAETWTRQARRETPATREATYLRRRRARAYRPAGPCCSSTAAP